MSEKKKNNLSNSLSNLSNTEKELLKLGKGVFTADSGNMFPVDFLALGAMKRTAGNTEGFITLVKAKNMSSARSLLRIQIDTFIRFHSVWLVESPHDFASEVIAGKHIRNIKDKSGHKMADWYLVEKLVPEYPWLKDVYNKLCGYIHFSEKHIFNAVQKTNDEERTITFHIGKEDEQYPESSWIEVVDCFTESVNIFFYYLESWIETKNSKKS